MNVVIAGNGIIGLQTAYQVSGANRNSKITLIGDFAHKGCASLAAAAMFNSYCEIDTGTFQNKFEEQKWLFNKMASAYWPQLLDELLAESGLPLTSGFGTYLINNTVSDTLEDENFDAIVAALEKFGEPYQYVSPREIPHYSPASPQRAQRAIFIEREGWVNPIQLFDCLKAILKKRGNVEFVDGTIEKLDYDANSASVVAIVLTNGTRITGDKFLLCPGAKFSEIVDQSNLPIRFQRVFFGVGATVLLDTGTRTLSNCIRTPNRGMACGVYSAPQTSTQTIIGASNLIAEQPYPNARLTSVFILLRAAMEQINDQFYRADLVRINVGWRPTSSDTLPMIGQTDVKNLLVATGTKRDGLHCSPLISTYLKDLLLTGRSDLDSQFDFSLFKPDRRPRKILSRKDAVDLAVRHTLSGAYQHDFIPGKSNIINDVQAYYRDFYERLHDEVGAVDFGIPPEMKDMFRYGHVKASDFER